MVKQANLVSFSDTIKDAMDESLWEILNMAGYAMWLILAFSVVALAVGIERAMSQWRFLDKARNLHENVIRCLRSGAADDGRSACERSESLMADVYAVGFERSGRTKIENVAAAVNRERLRVMASLRKRLWILGTIGATAPFVGLFGTVVGIMGAFGTISQTGKNDFGQVSGPIAEALYATAAGILVAVEAVIIFNYFNQKLQGISLETRLLTDEFVELLEETESQGEDDGARAAS